MKRISCIIRDLNPNPATVKFIPKDKDIEVVVSNWRASDFNNDSRASQLVESMAVARNDGAMQSQGEVLVFLDGDVKFSHDFFWKTVNLCKQGVVVGLENPYQHYLEGSYFVIMREDFFRSGGVDPHFFYNEDRAFSYKLSGMDVKLVLFPITMIEYLDQSPTRFCLSFLLCLRIQLALLFKYPHCHLPRFLLTMINYFYHKYVIRFKQRRRWRDRV